MTKDDADHGAYVRKVREDTQRYAQDLLAENERLRVLYATLESEKLSLQEQLAGVEAQLAQHREEQSRLRVELQHIEDETRRIGSRYAAVEHENSNLANLYVASYRLHGTIHRDEVIGVIQEIIANLVGSEEMAIFEMNPGGLSLSLVGSQGIEPEQYRTVQVGAGIIGGSVLRGETYLANGSGAPSGLPEEADLTACIPLRLDGKVTGAIALFRLLPQKTDGFEEVDGELFDLLATHAATALYCSGVQARLRAATPAPA